MVLGRLFTRCPLDDPREKAWTELRMQWLSEQFGIEPLLNAEVLLPTPEHFPEPYTGTPEDAERLMRRMCRQLQVDPTTNIVLKIQSDVEMPDAAGLYEEDDGTTTIRITESQLGDPEQLVSTLAHELAHQRLLGEKRLTGAEEDHERLTDLLPVFFGGGVFAANAVIREESVTEGRWHSWSIGKWGYLPARIFGYGFALFAWVRGEQSPAWARHLRRDARTTMMQSLKYLRKMEDSLFRPDTAGHEREPLTLEDLGSELRSGTPGRRIAALWEIQDRGTDAGPVAPPVVEALEDRSPAILTAALDAIAGIGEPDDEADRAVSLLLTHDHPEVRGKAAFALRAVSSSVDEAVQRIATLLEDANPAVVCWAAHALAKIGKPAAETTGGILRPLRRAVLRRDVGTANFCLLALAAVHDDPDALLRETFTDPEVYREANEILADLRDAEAAADAAETENAGERGASAP
ncbi:MAG: HEAT repeat domain-containing protein [Planctomycetaceae bacterium]